MHIPEGATPKDGPSAGITMCVALISALTKTPSRPDVAMTGEVTLRGRVLAVGGLKEKILAARQQGMKIILVPEENKDDVSEIMKEIGTHDGEVIFVKNMDEVLKLAFSRRPALASKDAKKVEEHKHGKHKIEKKKKEPIVQKTPARKIRIS